MEIVEKPFSFKKGALYFTTSGEQVFIKHFSQYRKYPLTGKLSTDSAGEFSYWNERGEHENPVFNLTQFEVEKCL
jgi:hypothetical protein